MDKMQLEYFNNCEGTFTQRGNALHYRLYHEQLLIEPWGKDRLVKRHTNNA